SAKGTPSDIYVGTRDIAEQLNAQAVNGKIVSLDNMIDKVAMKEKLSTALRELGAL
ncbi:PTS ascorbate transporter subunit IIB, partial [Proteus mirabilis]|nr:PTS ascorbate transporter subunit IIB [Proteus mirabilis]